jgi:pimeloyl-ACP methyl ester carboxylesterase
VTTSPAATAAADTTRSGPLLEELTLEAGGERLAASILRPASGRAPTILSLGGLGPTASRHVTRYLLDPLADQGHGSVIFDWSGNGDSTGAYLESSLRRRREELLVAARQLDPDEAPILIGTSMGAHLAAWTVPVLRPRGLVFFCPANYPQSATDVTFAGYLSNAVGASREDPRWVRPGPYADSPAYAGISQFTGDLVIVAARDDGVVPTSVIDGYVKNAHHARSIRVIWIDGSGHFAHRWLPDQPALKAHVLLAIRQLVCGQRSTTR